ncbi:hypothetical protein DM860_015177 [Cuscuta australis]|uniref:Uncharacterized protein n=1 Tax=Cuscuta australis TaxID=267555 RepID=A0A328DBT3_9ASTE|nr:hypothetical protein DM860_015177 [Cuscuta australis]
MCYEEERWNSRKKRKEEIQKDKRKRGIPGKNVEQENNQAQEDPISQEDELLNIENIDQINGEKFLVAQVEIEGNTEQRILGDELNTDQENGEDEVNTKKVYGEEEECSRKKKDGRVERKEEFKGSSPLSLDGMQDYCGNEKGLNKRVEDLVTADVGDVTEHAHKENDWVAPEHVTEDNSELEADVEDVRHVTEAMEACVEDLGHVIEPTHKENEELQADVGDGGHVADVTNVKKSSK